MNDQAILYALSTLAQTCAALAAFVGAIGLFRLQTLREERRSAEESVRAALVYHLGAARFCQRINDLRRVESTGIRGDGNPDDSGMPKIRSASLRPSFGYAGPRTAAFVELDDRSPSPI